MQSSDRQPLSRHDPQEHILSGAESATNRAPAPAVNAIMARLGLARECDEPGGDTTRLARDLTDPSWRVRVQTTQKLGKMGKQAPLELLLVALSDEEGSVRAAAARALGRNPRPAALAGLVKALEDMEWVVRAEAALALGQMGTLAPLEPLLAAARDSDASVRAAANRALGLVGAEHALEPLDAALQDEDWSVREAATLALGQLDGEDVLPSLLNARLDQDPTVRKAAETSLQHISSQPFPWTPPPSDTFAQWLERIRYPQAYRAASEEQPPAFAGRSVYTWQGQSRTSPAAARVKETRQQRLRALVTWSRKISHLAEGLLAAALMVCLIVAWLIIATQPRTTPVQLGSNNASLALTTYREHDSSVKQVVWAPDGQTIASADVRGTVCLWRASTGRTLQCYPNSGSVLALTWNSADTLLAAYAEPDQALQVQEYSFDSRPARQLLFQQTNLPGIPSAAAWSTDGATLAFDTGDGLVRIRNIMLSLDITSFQEKHNRYTELAWSADSTQLAALSADGQLQIWNTLTGQHITTLENDQLASIAIWASSNQDSGSSELLFDNTDGAIMRWWYNANSQTQEIYPFLSEKSYNIANISYLSISDLALSPDGSQLLLATSDGIVQARDSLTGNIIYIYTGQSAQVNDIAWSPDGQHIATASMDTTVQIWQEL